MSSHDAYSAPIICAGHGGLGARYVAYMQRAGWRPMTAIPHGGGCTLDLSSLLVTTPQKKPARVCELCPQPAWGRSRYCRVCADSEAERGKKLRAAAYEKRRTRRKHAIVQTTTG